MADAPGAEPTIDAPTRRSLLSEAAARLRAVVGDVADVEARWIVGEAVGAAPSELFAAPDEPVTALVVHRVRAMAERRVAGEPLQYVLGSWSFRGVELMVDPRVLIPRPETEVVVQAAVEELVRSGARVGRADPWAGALTNCTVADLGTGSGAIALALVTELPEVAVWATDVSASALAVARANLAGLGAAAARVRLVQGDWFDALPIELRGALRLVVSNPPYVSEAEHRALPPVVRAYEPYGALVSGPAGTECIEHIVSRAPEWLEPTGVLVCELAPHQAEFAVATALAAGYEEVEVRRDLSGRDRVLVARRSRASYR